ncbi:3-dehydroquinate synthase [Inhella inkyongensis]|uniref:3-dehydroquinate synthase n=1 Tax=Inhella inkyongensis TaxID=392593 RepID=UPI00110DB493
MGSLTIDLDARSYPIHIGKGGLTGVGALLPQDCTRVLLVSNETVMPLHGAALKAELALSGRPVDSFVLPDGEAHKNWQSLQSLLEFWAEAGADRHSVVLAFGGGVVGDLAGCAAALFMRGLRFIQIPTTLLAQVDSSVGGKTGINLPQGKNLVGSFHQPIAVWADQGLLRTLPEREFSAGLAEVIKYGPIADSEFFSWLEGAMPALRQRDSETLALAVRRSCEIKAAVVGADEREGGVRAILNFGHTFGHALEAGLGYGRLLHGEAVALGMVMAAELSHRHLGTDPALVSRLQALLRVAGLPIRAPRMDPALFMQLMRGDKKSVSGMVRYVLIPAIGQAELVAAPDEMALACVAAHSE